MGQVRKDTLNGWKEIASYIGRDIRTVERWEKQRGLPIRRVPGAGRAMVYANVSELEQWFSSANSGDGDDPNETVLQTTQVSAIDEPQGMSDRSGVSHIADLESAALHDRIGRKTARGIVAAALVLAVITTASVGWTLGLRNRWERFTNAPSAIEISHDGNRSIHYSFDVSRTTPGVPYPSRVAGVDDLYLRGIYSYEQRTADSLKHSEEYFSEAILKDAEYAPAYAGLSNTYNLQREYSVLPDAVAYPKAKAAAERAIALDPKLPQAHASLGFIDFFWSSDPVGAEHEFRRAIELDPSQVIAHHWYGSVLTHEGRFSEALEQLNIAQRLQPTSAAVLSSRALALGMSGRRGEAVDMLQELLNEAPSAPSPHQMLAILSLIEPRDLSRWLDESRRVATMRNDAGQLQRIALAEAAYRSGGEPAMWEALEKYEKQLHPPPEPPTFDMGAFEAALGHNDAAFEILIPSVRRRDPLSMIVKVDPRLTELRKDPRFAQMVAETRIPAAMQIR